MIYSVPSSRLQRQRTLLMAPGTAAAQPCYLWKHWAGSSYDVGKYDLSVPYAAGRYAVYGFGLTSGILSLASIRDGVPILNTSAASCSVTGAWATDAQALSYNGEYRRTIASGATIYATVTGHTLFVRGGVTGSGGFAKVAIDGDYTAANLLPAVGDAEIAAGYFAEADRGHRYIECYAANSRYDVQWCLAEGLTDAAHVVTVYVKATKRAAASSTRVLVSAISAATAGQAPNAAGASMGYVRRLLDPRISGQASAAVPVVSYNPTGGGGAQFMGEVHGNESAVSGAWAVDGVAGGPTAGNWLSGNAITYALATSLNHPDAAACCAKTVAFAASVTRPGWLDATVTLDWATAGDVDYFYAGMLPAIVLLTDGSAQTNPDFGRTWLRSYRGPNWQADDANRGGVRTLLGAMADLRHNTVSVLYLPSAAIMAGYQYDGSVGTYVRSRTTSDKLYIPRANITAPGPYEAVTADTVHGPWTVSWRLFRIPNAGVLLK